MVTIDLAHTRTHCHHSFCVEILIVEEKLLAEIKEHVGDALPTTENTKNMQYIDAVFAETVRLYPPVPIDTKTCVTDCVFPNNITIPAGTVCGYSPLLFGRMKSEWGDDAAVFRPERWIERATASGKPLQQCVSQYSYIHFNAGPRLCLGRGMAFLEAKTLLCMLLPRYRLTVVPNHDIAPRITVIYQMKHGLPVTAHPRESSTSA
jgi:fatty acid omega-hydroxylase